MTLGREFADDRSYGQSAWRADTSQRLGRGTTMPRSSCAACQAARQLPAHLAVSLQEQCTHTPWGRRWGTQPSPVRGLGTPAQRAPRVLCGRPQGELTISQPPPQEVRGSQALSPRCPGTTAEAAAATASVRFSAYCSSAWIQLGIKK